MWLTQHLRRWCPLPLFSLLHAEVRVYPLRQTQKTSRWNDGNSEAISTWCLPWLICATTNTNYTVYSLICDLSLPRLYLTIQRLNKRNLDFRPALKHRISPVQLNEVAIPYTGLEEFIFSSSTPESGRWQDQGSCPQLAHLASEGEEYTVERKGKEEGLSQIPILMVVCVRSVATRGTTHGSLSLFPSTSAAVSSLACAWSCLVCSSCDCQAALDRMKTVLLFPYLQSFYKDPVIHIRCGEESYRDTVAT